MKESVKAYKEYLSVIIAEDDPDHRELMTRSLEKSKLFNRIECVYSGDVCLERLSSEDYDIAVIDYKIPKLNGLELLKKAVGSGIDIPVVIVTGMGDERIAVEVMKEGAYDYIPKTGDLMYTLPHILSRALERYFLKKEFEKQEEKMRVMVQNLPVMAGALNEKFEITMWNRECELVTGYSAGEVIGKSDVIAMLLPDKKYRGKMLSLFSSRQGEFRDMEITMSCSDGSSKIVSWSSMPKHYQYAGGGTWAVGVDITERKKAEDALRESEEKLKIIFESIGEGLVIADMQGILQQVNKAFLKLLGFGSKDEVVGRYMMDFVSKDDISSALATLADTFKSGQSGTVEYRLRRKDGTEIDTEMSGTILNDKDGKPIGLLGLGRDISDRKKADEAIRESEAKYRLLADNVQDVIWTMDFGLRVTYITPSIEKLRGFTVDEVMSQTMDQVLTKNSLEKFYGIFMDEIKKIKNGTFQPVTVETEFIHKNGSTVYAESGITVLYDSDKRPAGLLGVTRDIGERKKLQEQLIHSEKLSAVGQLAAGVAHEFNNLLTVIMGRAQLAYEEDSAEEMRKSLVEIEKKTKQGSNLVKNLGAFARPNQPKFQAQDVADVIDEVIRLQKRQLQLENIEVEKEYRKHSRVLFDWSQIEQVFLNLLINAMHAIKPIGKGTILISVRDADGRVEVRFSDTGIGMDEETRMKVFEPFFTTKGAWSVDELGIPGTGLGLSISHSIIKQHSGTIDVESEKGSGTTFIINLPVCETAPAEEPVYAVKIPDDDLGELKNVRILVVDDEEDMVSLMKLLFMKAGFLNVLVEGSAERALAVFREFRPDIVFVDVLMPHMNGEQFFDGIQGIKKGVPVVFMTGKLDIDYRKYLKKGACAFIQKPFDIREVIDVLRRNLPGIRG